MTLLDSALKYAKRGWSVIPIEPRGKRPIDAWEEFQTRPASDLQIKMWFTGPGATRNLAVVTGAISNLVVIDLDTEEAKDALKAILGENQVLGVPRTKTGRGWQLFFEHPGTPLSNKAHVIPGLDVRGDGGYVIVPPSLHQNGKTYKWEVPLTDTLPPIPAELVEMIRRPVVDASAIATRFDTAGALKGVLEGQRDETLFKLACTLRGANVPQDMAERLVVEAAANCAPPFPERVALEKVDRAYRRFAPRDSTVKAVLSDAGMPRQPSFWPELITVKALVNAPPDPTEWLWDKALPAGTSSIVVAKPKVGKSNFAANLAIAVSRGVPFLGRPTRQASVGYLSLDASLQEISDTFAKFGVRESDPIMIHAGSAPSDSIKWITQRVAENQIRLLIIDTLQRLFRFRNINDYSEVNNTLEPLLDAMSSARCHVMFTHHAKKDSLDDLDSAIGSTAIRGLCYTYIHMARLPNSEQRVIKSDQRAGQNMPEMALTFDWKTGWLTLNGTMDDAMVRDARKVIAELLGNTEASMTETQIQMATMMRSITINKALNDMYKIGEVEREGRGRRGEPFRYSLAQSLASTTKNRVLDIFPGAKVVD